MAFGRSAIQSNVIALFMLQPRRRLASFLTAGRHAHTGSSTFEILSDVAVGRVTLAPRHVPFSGPLGGQYATLVGIVTAIAFDPLAHGRARRPHDRNRPAQNTTCRELQSFMRFWRVAELTGRNIAVGVDL
jgi:hypothetical protein